MTVRTGKGIKKRTARAQRRIHAARKTGAKRSRMDYDDSTKEGRQ